jgi:hypothetical protein
MDKYSDVMLWLILPLLTILPFAVYAETVRCTTELKRICDSAQACTTTSSIHPVVEYLIDLPNKPGSAKIVKLVGGKKVASWKPGLTSGEDDSRHEYSVSNDDSGKFTLSESFKTFSYKFVTVIGNSGWEQNELGICSAGAPWKSSTQKD